MQKTITEKIEGVLNTNLPSGNLIAVGTLLREMQEQIADLTVQVEQLKEGK